MRIIWIMLMFSMSILTSCSPSANSISLAEGPWVFSIDLEPEQLAIPGNWEGANNSGGFILSMAEEDTPLRVEFRGKDSLYLYDPAFNSVFRARMLSPEHIQGTWTNTSRKADYVLNFEAKAGRPDLLEAGGDVSGRWSVMFSPETEEQYPAVGVFEQKGSRVTGTFLTETGDYRFLEGSMQGGKLSLDAWDGAHAFHFEAELDTAGNLAGTFRSGNHWREPWIGQANPEASLRDANELTYLVEGAGPFTFSFPSLQGKTISLKDEQFKDKVVIVQLMGTWCPNCLDETRLFNQWYDAYHDQGLEIIALAFERSEDFAVAAEVVDRYQKRLGIHYPFLIAGKNSKQEASDKFPMLSQITSFPTAIVLNKEHEVIRIHTGFSGPGTGIVYQDYVTEMETLLKGLLQ